MCVCCALYVLRASMQDIASQSDVPPPPKDDLPPIRSIWIDASGLFVPESPLKLPQTAYGISEVEYHLEKDYGKMRGANVLIGRPDDIGLWCHRSLPDYKKVAREVWHNIIVQMDEVPPYRRFPQIILQCYGDRRWNVLTQDVDELKMLELQCEALTPKPPSYDELKQVARFLRIGSVWRVKSWDEVQMVLDWVHTQATLRTWRPFPDTWPLDRMPDECWYPPEWNLEHDQKGAKSIPDDA